MKSKKQILLSMAIVACVALLVGNGGTGTPRFSARENTVEGGTIGGFIPSGIAVASVGKGIEINRVAGGETGYIA